MKKTIILSAVIMLGFFSISKAQSIDVTNAALSLRNGELKDAKASIDKATTDADAILQPKTWVYCGNIYLAMFQDSGKTVPQLASYVDVAANAFQKVPALDAKKKWEDDVTSGLNSCHYYLYTMAIDPYNRGHYDSAYFQFRKAYDVSHFLNKTYQDEIDSNSLVQTAYTAYLSNMNDTAYRLYKELFALKYGDKNSYHQFSEVCLAKKDTAEGLAAVRAGSKRFDNPEMLMIDEINILIETNHTQDAVDMLTKAIADHPDSLKYYYVLGEKYDDLGKHDDAEKIFNSLIAHLQDKITKSGGKSADYGTLGSAYGRLGRYDEAATAFKTAIDNEKDNSKKADWNFKAGAMYFNQAAELNSKLDKASAADAQKMIKDRDDLFKRALPFLEESRTLNPLNYDTLDALRQLYGAMSMTDKYMEVKKAMDELNNGGH